MTRLIALTAAAVSFTVVPAADAGCSPSGCSRAVSPAISVIRQHDVIQARRLGLQTVSLPAVTPEPPAPECVFGGFDHVDELAYELELLSKEFCLDLYYNYSHNYGFQQTYTEAYQIFEVAQYIHSLERCCQHRAEIRQRLAGLDSLFRHVQLDVSGWTRHHVQQVGHLGIQAKMAQIEATLHHLMNDVGVHLTPVGGPALNTPPAPTTFLNNPPNPAGL